MKFKLEIDMENDAFNNTVFELSQCLSSVISKLSLIEDDDWFNWHKIRDSNGNSVGNWVVIIEDKE